MTNTSSDSGSTNWRGSPFPLPPSPYLIRIQFKTQSHLSPPPPTHLQQQPHRSCLPSLSLPWVTSTYTFINSLKHKYHPIRPKKNPVTHVNITLPLYSAPVKPSGDFPGHPNTDEAQTYRRPRSPGQRSKAESLLWPGKLFFAHMLVTCSMSSTLLKVLPEMNYSIITIWKLVALLYPCHRSEHESTESKELFSGHTP